MEERKDYGSVTVGYGKPEEREIPIIEFIKSSYKDDRIVSVAKLEDDTYCLSVENVASSGRNPSNTMRLSRESFIGLLATSLLYLSVKGEDMLELTKKSIDGDTLRYHLSDNLKPFSTTP